LKRIRHHIIGRVDGSPEERYLDGVVARVVASAAPEGVRQDGCFVAHLRIEFFHRGG
jgi:hypothetical protein